MVLVKEKSYSKQMEGEILKFFKIYSGPYKVKKKLGSVIYILTHEDKRETEKGMYHTYMLKKGLLHFI